MSLVQRRPMPLVGSNNPYDTNPGYQSSRYADQRPSNAVSAASRPRPRAMSNSSSSAPRYQTPTTDNTRRYYAEQAPPPSSYNRGTPAPPTTPRSTRSRSQSQSRPRREPTVEDTAEAYARTPNDHRHQAQTRPDANTSYSSESSGYAPEQAAPASYGTSIWDRVASAVTNLSVNVGLADSSVLADGERTPPGCESRICVALKDYYITRATSGEDLPDWLFSLEERRAAGGGSGKGSRDGTMDGNEGGYGDDDERHRRQGRDGRPAGDVRSRSRSRANNGYSSSASASASNSRPSREPSAAPPTGTSRFRQIRDAKRGITAGSGGGGSLDAGIRERVPPPNSTQTQTQTGSYSDGDRSGSYHRSRGPPYQGDVSRGNATGARGLIDDTHATSTPAPRPRPTAMGLPTGPRRR